MWFSSTLRISWAFILLLSQSALAANETGNIIWNVPHQEREFIGRQRELEDLKKLLATRLLVEVVGLAGMGKTSFAKQVAFQNKHTYKVIWYVDARRDVQSQLFELAVELSKHKHIDDNFSPHDVIQGSKIALNWLQSTEVSWLLIFDNVTNHEDLDPYIPVTYNCTLKHIILTTRHASDNNKSLQLGGFSDSESVGFLRNNLGDGYEERDLASLASMLGNHPRALLQASLHILRTPGMSCKKYSEMFVGNNKRLTKEEKMILSKQEVSVELHSSLEMLMDEIYKSSPESLTFLAALSFLSSSIIEEDLLIKFQETLGHSGQLTYLHLIKPQLLIKDKNHYYIHPYVATVVQNYIKDDAKNKALETALTVLVSCLDKEPDVQAKNFGGNSNLLDHILELTRQYTGASELATELEVSALFYIYYYQRRFDISIDIGERCKARIERRQSTHPILEEARFYSLYSFFEYGKGTAAEAVESCLKAKSILDRIDSQAAKDELVLLLCNNLGYYYKYQGETAKALQCANDAIEIMGENKTEKGRLMVLFLKICCAIDEGDFVVATKYVKEEENLLYKNEFFKTVGHYVYQLAAKVEIKKSNMPLARKYAESAYKLALECVGNDEQHESVSRAGAVLALCRLYTGDLEEAHHLIDNAIEGFTKGFRADSKNRRQAYALMVKGDIMSKKDDLLSAQKCYLKAMGIYNAELTNMKIDDVSELCLRLIELGINIGDVTTVRTYFEKHIAIFGLSHPRTVVAAQKMKEAGIAL